MKFALATLLFVTIMQAQDPAYQPDDHMDMFLLVFGLAAAFITLAITTLGALIFLAIVGLIVLLIFAGIVSASVFAGFLSRSWSSGLKAFVYLVCAALGVAFGIPFAWVTGEIFHLAFSGLAVLFLGGVSGIVGGIVLAWMIIFGFRKLGRYLGKTPGVVK